MGMVVINSVLYFNMVKNQFLFTRWTKYCGSMNLVISTLNLGDRTGGIFAN